MKPILISILAMQSLAPVSVPEPVGQAMAKAYTVTRENGSGGISAVHVFKLEDWDWDADWEYKQFSQEVLALAKAADLKVRDIAASGTMEDVFGLYVTKFFAAEYAINDSSLDKEAAVILGYYEGLARGEDLTWTFKGERRLDDRIQGFDIAMTKDQQYALVRVWELGSGGR